MALTPYLMDSVTGLPVKPLVYVKRTKLKFGEESYDYVSEESTESESEEWGSKPKKKQPKIVPDFTRKVKNPRKFMEDKKKQEERNSKKAKKTKKPVNNPSTSTCTITSQTRSQQKQQTTSQTTNQQQTTTSRATTTTKVQQLKKKRVRSPVVETRESRYPKRDGMRKDYREEEVPDDDHYLFCEACGEFFYGDCPTHGPLFPHADKETSGSKESLPEGLVIKESTIPSAGLGVFATQSFDVGVRFGPYVGKKICPYVPKDEVDTSYMWEIMKEGRVVYFIDGKEERFGNWMRYINCSRTEGEQNLVAFQYHGEIYYRVYKSIIKYTELLVWYGEEYAQDLGMSTQDDPNTDQLQTYTDKRFPCKFCDICFSDEKYLMPHAKRCTQRFIKPCDNSLTQPLLNYNSTTKGCSGVKNIKQIHNPESKTGKQFKCDYCEYSSNQNSKLKTHIRTHTGEKPYKCTRCDAAFAQGSNLKKHTRTHTGEKPYKCTRCDAAFAQGNHLKKHMRTHTGEKPYKCTQCYAAFAQNNNLKTHMRTHTGEKPYKCTHCEDAAACSCN